MAESESLNIEDHINNLCPWSEKPVQAQSLTGYLNQAVRFCSRGGKD